MNTSNPNERIKSELRNLFEDQGLRNTSQREAIIDFFFSTEDHVTVRDVARSLEKQGIKVGISSVYRTMNLLVQYGLAREVRFEGDEESRYEHLHIDEHHDHFVCKECGAIDEFHDNALHDIISATAHRFGFKQLYHNLNIYGICSKCSGERAGSVPLAGLQAGEKCTVKTLRGGREFKSRLASMGLCPGAEISVLKRYPNGPMILIVQGSRLALGKGMTDKIEVAL